MVVSKVSLISGLLVCVTKAGSEVLFLSDRTRDMSGCTHLLCILCSRWPMSNNYLYVCVSMNMCECMYSVPERTLSPLEFRKVIVSCLM